MRLLCLAQIKLLHRRRVDSQSAAAIFLLKVAFSREQNSLCCSQGFVLGLSPSWPEAFPSVLHQKKKKRHRRGLPAVPISPPGWFLSPFRLRRKCANLVGQADQDVSTPAPADPELPLGAHQYTTVRVSLLSVVFAVSTPGFQGSSHFSTLINCRLARGGFSHQ